MSFHDNVAIAVRQSASGTGGGNSARLWNMKSDVPAMSTDLDIDANTYCVDQPVTFRVGGTSTTPMIFADWQALGWDTTSTLVDEASCPPLR